jgi:protein-disulfide isomerase
MPLPFARLTRNAVLAALILPALPASAQAPAFTDQQRQGIEQIVKDYLLKNPELLQDVMAELEKRQQEAQRNAQQSALRESRNALMNSPRDIVAGNAAGDVTMVEFFDYNCGYCKRALADMRGLIKSDPKLRVVLKDFPVLGPDSVEASRVGLAVQKQLKGEKLFEYHGKLMDTRGRVNGERAISLAKEMGVDAAKLQKDMDSPEVRETIQENVVLGDKLGLTGTPAFILGDEVISGAVGPEPLRKTIASLRQCGKATC